MRRILPRTIRTLGLLVAAFLLVAQASAHPGHRAEAATIALGSHVADRSLPQVHADRSCPDDDGGSCCCSEQAAHAPSQPHALPTPQARALTGPRPPRARIVVVRNDVPAVLPPLVGSRSSRGPPPA